MRTLKLVLATQIETLPKGAFEKEGNMTEVETPLYVSIPDAAKIAGISEDMMRQFANAAYEPIPHIVSGRKKLIRVASIADYLKTKERR